MKNTNKANAALLAFVLSGPLFAQGCQMDASPAVDAQHSNPAPYIIGGEPFNGKPAVGSLFAIVGGKSKFFCTGTLIRRDAVLTAGHCLQNKLNLKDNIRFHIGPNGHSPEHVLRAKEIVIHPRHNLQGENNYDIAIILLADNAPEDVAPAALIDGIDPSSWADQQITVTSMGYGRTVRPDDGPDADSGSQKRRVELTVVDVIATKVKTESPGRSACNGDSGGPLLYENDSGDLLVAGVTSSGDVNCNGWGTYTRVDAFRAFIANPKNYNRDHDPDIGTASCHGVTERGHCDGDTAKRCVYDGYQGQQFSTMCDNGQECWQDWQAGSHVVCRNPEEYSTVTMRFPSLRIDRDTGEYVIAERQVPNTYFVRIDNLDLKAAPYEKWMPTNEDNTAFIFDMRHGEHTFKYLSHCSYGHNDPRIAPLTFEVTPHGPNEFVFYESFLEFRLEIDIDVGIGNALYISGKGFLLGDWETATQLSYENGKWVYEGHLPPFLQYRILKGQRSAASHVETANLTWESGADRAIPTGFGQKCSRLVQLDASQVRF